MGKAYRALFTCIIALIFPKRFGFFFFPPLGAEAYPDQGQLDAHSDLHRSTSVLTTAIATEAELGHPVVFHSHFYLAPFPAPFSQSPITEDTSSSTLSNVPPPAFPHLLLQRAER